MIRTPRESERIYERPGEEYAPATCKHGVRRRCDTCGTGASDTPHTTRGGRGVVARLREEGGR